MATGTLPRVPGHRPEHRRRPIQLAGCPRATLPRKAAALQDPSRAAFCLPHHSLKSPGRTPGALWLLCLSVPVCRMGRHGGTSASCSYPGQCSPLTLAGGPAERGLAAESGRQRPLTRSSLLPLAPDLLQEPSEPMRHESRRPERPTMCTTPESCAALPFGPPDSSTLWHHSRLARAHPSRLRPQCALR